MATAFEGARDVCDFDPRNRDSHGRDDGIHDRDEEWLTLGRGAASPAASDGAADDDVRDRKKDSPGARGRDSRDRDDERSGSDPRDVFMRDLDLPQGPERELVRDRDREYTLSGSDTRTLSTVGAFRVVAELDLRDDR